MAWIGLFHTVVLDKNISRSVEEWSSLKTGSPIYQVFTCHDRFKRFKQWIRLIVMSTCAAWKDGEQEKLAPLYEIWQNFIELFQKNYNTKFYVTIDWPF